MKGIVIVLFIAFSFIKTSSGSSCVNYEEIDELRSTVAKLTEQQEKLLQMMHSIQKVESKNVPNVSPLLHGWGYINAADSPYNATGDGSTDDTASIQKALDAAGALGGGIVFLPTGTYMIKGHLQVHANVVLKGVQSSPWRSWASGPGTPTGTTLLAVEGAGKDSGDPFINLIGPDATVEGLNIFYPNQVAKNPPTPYPWTIAGSGDNLTIKNLLLVNSYQGIDFATKPCGRHYIEGVYGQPLLTGIAVDQCYDIGRIKHIHFWPFWSQDKDLIAWQNNNAVTFRFYRSDWEVVEDVFSWGYNIGMSFTASANGALNGQFTDINFDNVDIGIYLKDTQQWGVFFSNLNLANAGGGSHHISILGDTGGNAVASFRGVSSWGDVYQPVVWNNAGVITLADSFFWNWQSDKSAVYIQSGRAILRGLYFKDVIGTGITIGPNTDRVMVTDNEMVGNKIINNGSDTLVANNHM